LVKNYGGKQTMKVNINNIWPEYELIDCGNFRKLERFGDIILIRPEITSDSNQIIPESEWYTMAHAEFIEKTKNSGEWKFFQNVPDKWFINYNSSQINIVAELSLTNSKHIGVFPEQVLNWKFIENQFKGSSEMEILNLFGYTGLTSVAAAAYAKTVTHIDSIKKVVDWTRRNADNSGLTNIRCIVEDAQKFVLREIKRNNKYDGIILDPPAIGVGAKNEKWMFDEMIDDLLKNVAIILKSNSFIIMNLYSHSINDKYIHRLLLTYFPKHKFDFCEKVFGQSSSGNVIDHGYFVRLIKQ